MLYWCPGQDETRKELLSLQPGPGSNLFKAGGGLSSSGLAFFFSMLLVPVDLCSYVFIGSLLFFHDSLRSMKTGIWFAIFPVTSKGPGTEVALGLSLTI